jgi:hypothetical protein
VRRLLGLALLLACAGSSAQQFNVQRVMHCEAKPYCGNPRATCKGVEKDFRGSAAGSARNSIIQACIQANRPDRCNCIQQCREVARCELVR